MRQIFVPLAVALVMAGTVPAWAQNPLYPVLPGNIFNTVVRIQRPPDPDGPRVFVAEKTLEYQIKLGYPTEIQAGFLQSTKAKMIVLWLTVENLAQRPLELDLTKFTVKDEKGRIYASLAPEEAYKRIVSGTPFTKSVLSKGISGISLGRAGGNDEGDRDEAVRFALKSGTIAAQAVREGLLFFEGPDAKQFTVNVSLGDLWSRPFVFTNVKRK